MGHRAHTLVALLAVLSLDACGRADTTGSASSTWVGTITTEGSVTTVINESGSVWGGTARLVEEMSIGVEIGADEYMLGSVSGLVATADYFVIADGQVPAVRVYDLDGSFVRDLGTQGQGPGEYVRPMEVGIGSSGQVVVKDGNRILAYTIDGENVATWSVGKLLAFTMVEMPMVVTHAGVAHAPIVLDISAAAAGSWEMGMLPVDGGGEPGEPIAVPEFEGVPRLLLRNTDTEIPVPFGHEWVWAFTPSGAMAAGNSIDYRFRIQRPSGETLVVERAWEPIPVEMEEARWHRRSTTHRIRRNTEGWVWNGPGIPAAKPAYQRLMPDRSGRMWVQRAGAGERSAECVSGPSDEDAFVDCWRDGILLDVFDEDGRFLGGVDPPAGLRLFPRPFIKDDQVLAVVEDGAGTIMVKRYRLVLPGDETR